MSALGSTSKVISLSEQRELSAAAKALLADKAFSHAFLATQQQYVGEILSLKAAGARQDELCALLRAQETFFAHLSALLNADDREALRRIVRNA